MLQQTQVEQVPSNPHMLSLLLLLVIHLHNVHHTPPVLVSGTPSCHSSLLRSLPLKATGRIATTANTARSPTLVRFQASDVDVNLCSVVPAWTNTNDGGATPVETENEKCITSIKLWVELMVLNMSVF